MEQTISKLFDTLSSAVHHNDQQLAGSTIHSPCTFLRKQGNEVIHNQYDALSSLRYLLNIRSDQPIIDVHYQLLDSKPLTSRLSLIKLNWMIQQPDQTEDLLHEGRYFVIEEQQQSKILSVIADGDMQAIGGSRAVY